ncbi:MAG: hypothetical protein LLG24_00855 [Actinomycetia bacterium]|nr:hypothetical protein [Actinomycetes bacterium]
MATESHRRMLFTCIAMTAALAMVVSMLTGCGQNEQDTTPANRNPSGASSTSGTTSTVVPGVETSTPATRSPAATPTTSGPAAGAGNAPASASDDIFSKYGVPQYPGMEPLAKAVPFEWPGIDKYKAMATGADWGYYSVDATQKEISDYYRGKIKDPTSKKRELFFFDRGPEGLMSIFFDDVRLVWIRVWAIPQPGDASKSYIVIAVEENYHFCGG